MNNTMKSVLTMNHIIVVQYLMSKLLALFLTSSKHVYLLN